MEDIKNIDNEQKVVEEPIVEIEEEVEIIETEYQVFGRTIGYAINTVGYSIYLDDNLWVRQTTYIPYKADTMEESALLHIQEIVESSQEPDENITAQLIDEIIMLKECILELSEIIYE